MKKTKIEKFVPITLVILLLALGFYNHALPQNDPFGIYGNRVKNFSTPIHFKDRAETLGLNHTHAIYDPSPEFANLYPYHANNASVAVSDIDNDGFVDLFFTTMKDGNSNHLYRNIKGERFQDVTSEAGLGKDLNYPGASTAAVFFDYNNDGCQDLFIARIGCHTLYAGNCKGQFKDVSEESGVNKICSFAVGVNLVDYNNDGHTDLYIPNFNAGEPKIAKNFYRLISDTSNNADGGGENILLENRNGHFVNVAKEKHVNDPGLSWASGWLDVNGDGLPDLYVADDFSHDNFFMAKPDGSFRSMTEEIFRPAIRSRGSMTVETGDIDNDLRTDIYVTNISRPGFDFGLNYLWLNKSKDGYTTLFNRAAKLDVDKCGWGWGAKFLDADLDGHLEIVVNNGFWDDGKKPYWYAWNTWLSLPTFLRGNSKNQPNVRGTHLANNEPNCFFKRVEGKFVDIAESAGITDLKNGRGMASLDFNNDGKPDFVIANFLDKPSFYVNETQTKNNWIGFKLEGTKSNRDGIGAKVYVFVKGKLKQMKELFPANGLAGENDKRLLFGLGESHKAKVKIVWPSGVEQDLGVMDGNQYHDIKE